MATYNKGFKVFDNIGFDFKINNELLIIPIKNIQSYNSLNTNHIGYSIPYIARNKKLNLIEIGAGTVVVDNYGQIAIQRNTIVLSSNNNTLVAFPDFNNEFYIFANQTYFDKNNNNVIVLNSTTSLDPVSALYLIDASTNDINLLLPNNNCDNLIIEFKRIDNSNNLVVLRHSNESVLITIKSAEYYRIAFNGSDWSIIDQTQSGNYVTEVLSNTGANVVSALSTDTFVIPYSDGGELRSTSLYWDTINSGLLFGSDTALQAQSIISAKPYSDIIFNRSGTGKDFIVHGSGNNRNLFFTYDGKLGLNLPVDSRPITTTHIVNHSCQEILRLENRNSCFPTNITLYHKPPSAIPNNSTIAQINLAAKNSGNNLINYAQIQAKSLNSNSKTEKGSLEITLIAPSDSSVTTLNTTTDSTYLGYPTSNIYISGGSGISLKADSAQLDLSSIRLSSNVPVFAPGVSGVAIQSDTITAKNINLSELTANRLLRLDNSKNIVSSNVELSANGLLKLPNISGKILTTTNDGSVTGVYGLSDYFRTENDIVWHKNNRRQATICLRQIIFTDVVDISEFDNNDQILIALSGSNFYRTIQELDVSNNTIVGCLIDQPISATETNIIDVVSITKGSYLTFDTKVDPGIESDATSTIISNKPFVDTIFNSKNKDIDLIVYGIEDKPAILVKANSGRGLSHISSGIYYSFAAQRNDIFSILVNSSGSGVSNTYSSANYNYFNGTTTNLFNGVVSSVGSNGQPSYYGAYDMNGNAAEWVDPPDRTDFPNTRNTEFAAGGSWKTIVDENIGSSGLKSYDPRVRVSGFEDVGFRVASPNLLNDIFKIIDTSVSGLGMSFVVVGDPNNISDTSTTYIKNDTTQNPGDPEYMPYVQNNLGVSNRAFRISKHEITNNQYCEFLNSVATQDVQGLYDTRMGSSNKGGIVRTGTNGSYLYTVKSNMSNKPVLFVSYINALRFCNWLHNGADYANTYQEALPLIENGSYEIISDSNSVSKNSNVKYTIPTINQWHKAAYYKPVNASIIRDTTTVNIKRDTPYIVATGLQTTTRAPTTVFANMSISGWLYVDHIIVGDGTIRSSPDKTGLDFGGGAGTNTDIQSDGLPSRPSNLNAIISNPSVSIIGGTVSCLSAGCVFDAKPLRLDEDVSSLCAPGDGEDTSNIPWWCDPNSAGPGWF